MTARWTVGGVGEVSNGSVTGNPETAIHRFVTDSRDAGPGACFVALVDERDGHDFVTDAVERGAVAAIVTRPVADVDCAQIVVSDVFEALAHLGRAAREDLAHVTLVGVAGSAGKTSTKDLAAGAFGAARRVHANQKSYNNEFGVPITILGAAPETEVIIAELGERKPGDLAHLARITTPNAAIITHIGLAHAEFLGGRAGVAETIAELLEALPADGVAILNADDDYTAMLRTRTAATVVTVGYGIEVEPDVRISEVGLDAELRPSFRFESPWGSGTVHLELRGEHQAANAAMAAAAAMHHGIDPDLVSDALAEVTAASWRMQVTRTDTGLVVLNDAYNANPASMAAALRAFQKLPVEGRRIAVLGTMAELGSHTEAAHVELGQTIARSDLDVLVAVGEPARATAAHAAPVATEWVADAPAALAVLDGLRLGSGDAVLVKASRSVGLEALADALIAEGVRS